MTAHDDDETSGEQSGPPILARPDPLDLDPADDWIDSRWDRDAEDRDINRYRRGRSDHV